MQITLADGTATDLAILDHQALWELQFEQERAFAEQILEAPKGSRERQDRIERGYDTVCTILATMRRERGTLVMGLDARYVQLVLRMLRRRHHEHSRVPSLFEIGYGSGAMLRDAAVAGYNVAGIEVSSKVREQALRQVPHEWHHALHLGDFLRHDLNACNGQFDVVYWNDVFEHIPPDEIDDFLERIYALLRPGGMLVTITPNWHERPSDVSGDFLPVRTDAVGLHLKEYTLREVTAHLRKAGFLRIETPLVVLPGRIVLGLGGLASLKRLLEPALEYLPFSVAYRLCHGLGLAYTMATR